MWQEPTNSLRCVPPIPCASFPYSGLFDASFTLFPESWEPHWLPTLQCSKRGLKEVSEGSIPGLTVGTQVLPCSCAYSTTASRKQKNCSTKWFLRQSIIPEKLNLSNSLDLLHSAGSVLCVTPGSPHSPTVSKTPRAMSGTEGALPPGSPAHLLPQD